MLRAWMALTLLRGAALAQAPPCYRSSLGFQCMLQVCSTIAVHWSVGGDPPAPATCAYATPSSTGGTSSVLASMNQQQLDGLVVHWALQATEFTGYVALSFPAVGGRMVPADAVAGFVPEGSSTPAVRPYYIQGFTEGSNQVDTSVVLNHTGVVQQAQQLVVCFSRPLATQGQAKVPLSVDGMPMNFASGREHRLTDHEGECAVVLGLRATLNAAADFVPVGGNVGQAFESDEGEVLAHGWLMLVAWALLVPLGAFVAQFKEQANPLLAAKLNLKPAAPWFPVHVTAQSLAMVLYLVALWVIISAKGLETSEWEGLTRAHGGLAITIFILLALHLIFAACRPKPDAPVRPLWAAAHRWAARCIYLLVFINLMTGPKLLARQTDEGGAATALVVITLLLTSGYGVLWVVAWRRQRHAAGGGSGEAYQQVVMLGGMGGTFSSS